MLPAAAVAGAVMRDAGPAWFLLHRVLGCLGFATGAAAVGLGLAMRPVAGPKEQVHQAFGLAVVALVALQLSSLLLRPAPVRPRAPPHRRSMLYNSRIE